MRGELKRRMTGSREEEGAGARGSSWGATHTPWLGGAQNITLLPSNTPSEHDST